MRKHSPCSLFSAMALAVVSLLFLVDAGSACASTTAYLRPNADLSSSQPWAVIGAGSAWEALADGVTETQAPAGAGYIASSESTGYTSVGLKTIPLAGTSEVQATAWVYTASANRTTVEVLKSDGGGRIAAGYPIAAGWNAIPIKRALTQIELDNAVLKFRATPSKPQQISAAFLKVTYTPSPPKVYWGAWMSGETYGGTGDVPWSTVTANTFEAHATRAPSIVHFGQPAPWNQAFTSQPLSLARARGAIPLIDMGSEGASLKEIEDGSKDSYLASWARAAREYGKPFFLRWDWEMNGTWFPWGKEAAANPKQFKNAWQHFHEIAEAQGATNITWVWCPNTRFTGATPLSYLYPGSEYVDWTCIDGYNRGSNPIEPAGWTKFLTLFSPTYSSMKTLAAGKPVMIGETASTEIGGSKAEWIDDAFSTQLPRRFPNVKAISWFNWNYPEEKGRWDWQIESSQSAQAAFANVISSPYYAGNTFGSLPSLTRIQPLP